MFNLVLSVWGVALLLSLSCWSVGAALVRSQSPVVGMLCGWCLFLLLCSLPWMIGVPTHTLRPLFWVFFAAGLVLTFKNRRWPELACAGLCTAAISAMLCAPFFRVPGLLAYGAHGTDMWGYVITAEWLQTHSYFHLPELGVDPMRFNWTWHVLFVHERPLNYSSLACLASATGLSTVNAYLAYLTVLLASLAMALAREPKIFRLWHWSLAVVPALIVVFHPLLVLQWIAGFFGGSIAAGFVALGFAGAAVHETGRARTEALCLSTLMLVFCGALYSQKILLVALVVGGAPVLLAVIVMLLRHDFSPLRGNRPGRLASAVLGFLFVVCIGLLLLGSDQPPNTGLSEDPLTAAGHFLGIFGGSSPFVWLGYDFSRAFDRIPLSNPVGLAAAGLMLVLFVSVSWTRWAASRDLRADVQIPLLAGLAVGVIAVSHDDELIMAKTLTVFGFTLLYLLAVVSSQLRHWTLGLAALLVCCTPGVRSAVEMRDIIWGPYIECTEVNMTNDIDGQVWRSLAFLYFREDKEGVDWSKYPKTYGDITHFLPVSAQERIAKRYHMPKSW